MAMMDRFDGYSVDAYAGRFSGTFDIEDQDGRSLRHGDEVLMLVSGKVGRATMDENSAGDMKRTQTIKTDSIHFVTADQVEDLLIELGIPHQLTLVPAQPSEVQQSDDFAVGVTGFSLTPQPEPTVEDVTDVGTDDVVRIQAVKVTDPTLARFLADTPA